MWTELTSSALGLLTACAAAAAVAFGALICYWECLTRLCESVSEHMAGQIKSSLWWQQDAGRLMGYWERVTQMLTHWGDTHTYINTQRQKSKCKNFRTQSFGLQQHRESFAHVDTSLNQPQSYRHMKPEQGKRNGACIYWNPLFMSTS